MTFRNAQFFLGLSLEPTFQFSTAPRNRWPASATTLGPESGNDFHNAPHPNDVQWLHWMALILVTTVHMGSSAFFKPADSIATVNGNLRRNITVFLLLLGILTYVSKPIE
jgi:hypothetical protein